MWLKLDQALAALAPCQPNVSEFLSVTACHCIIINWPCLYSVKPFAGRDIIAIDPWLILRFLYLAWFGGKFGTFAQFTIVLLLTPTEFTMLFSTTLSSLLKQWEPIIVISCSVVCQLFIKSFCYSNRNALAGVSEMCWNFTATCTIETMLTSLLSTLRPQCHNFNPIIHSKQRFVKCLLVVCAVCQDRSE